MKILWLFNHPAPYKIDFFNELGKKCELTAVFERRKEGDRPDAFYYGEAKNFKMVILNSIHFGPYNNFTSKAKSIIKKEQFDIIVMNGWSSFTEMSVLKYLKKNNIPYIFAINGGIEKRGEASWKRKAKIKYLDGAKLYLSPDQNSAKYLKYYGVDPKRIRLYPYSTVYENELPSKPLNKEEREASKKELGLREGKLYMAVGSFSERKNDSLLLKLWKDVSKDKVLMLVGTGPEEKAYRKMIAEEGLDNVEIRPFTTHTTLLQWFRAADASILLTKEDIYGHVINESLSQGTPVISSRYSNAAMKLIKDGVNGRLVNIEDEDEVLSALKMDIDESFRAEALKVAKENTIEKQSDFHMAVFEEFLAK